MDACVVSGFVMVIPVEFGESGDAMIGSGNVYCFEGTGGSLRVSSV